MARKAYPTTLISKQTTEWEESASNQGPKVSRWATEQRNGPGIQILSPGVYGGNIFIVPCRKGIWEPTEPPQYNPAHHTLGLRGLLMTGKLSFPLWQVWDQEVRYPLGLWYSNTGRKRHQAPVNNICFLSQRQGSTFFFFCLLPCCEYRASAWNSTCFLLLVRLSLNS